jgi:molybdopterin-guanine dinucleotide biosynthesis protein B
MIARAIHIVGRRNHGKTTLVVELIGELVRRGVRVGSIKHSSHDHELDAPGKDSHRHRRAGAAPVAVVTPAAAAIHLPLSNPEAFARIGPLFEDCELVLVEGWIDRPGWPKVEVWRAAAGGVPLAAGRADISAVITDDAAEVDVPRWPRGDVAGLCDRLLDAARRG